MPKATKHIPDGYHAVTPYLIVDGAAKAIDFYKKVFDVVERMRMPGPDGRIGHAEILIEGSNIMLADEAPQMGAKGPHSLGGSPMFLHVYVQDVDATVKAAVAAGAKIARPVADQFYGDRSGVIEDPFGHRWNIGTHKEDVSPDEMERRAKEAMKNM